MKTFSEEGEDKLILKHFLARIKQGFIGKYLDIGCFHENERSNTKLLNMCRWEGIAVDANPDLILHWQEKRPNDLFLNLAISPTLCSNQYEKLIKTGIKNKLIFYRFLGAQVSTIDRDLANEYVGRGYIPRDSLIVDSITLRELAVLIQNASPNFCPDFLNIDIERVDYLEDLAFFLESLQFPEYLCIEWVSQGYDSNNMTQSREYKILSELGYQLQSISANLHCIMVK